MALIALIAAAEAVGSAPAPVAAAPSTAVEIALAAPAPEAAASVREDLEELLGRRGLAARYRVVAAINRDEVLRPAAEAPCSLACIWIDLGVATAGRALVYISATASDQVVIRALPLPRGLDEVAREEVSHIVATSVEALQAGRPLPLTPEPGAIALAKSEPPPPPAPPAPRGRWLAAGVGAGAARESAGTLALPTVTLSVLVGPEGWRASPAFWVQGGGFASDATSDAASPVTLRFRGGELAVLGAVGTSPGGRVAARFGVGPGLEVRETTPELAAGAAPAGVALQGSRFDPALFVRAAARFEVPITEGFGVFAVAACDARVLNARYMVDRPGGGADVLYAPDRLRPSVTVGVEALFAGGGAP